MSDLAIKAEHLGKLYRIGERERYKTLRDTITSALSSPFRKRTKTDPGESTLWALHDVSFEIGRGEILGIIGGNGAGKSTLLKVLSRITSPTTGIATIHGRVGSLLEVGTGFHPELTGRENIFLNGAILGMRKVEIEKQFDAIVAFAEIDRFIDTPVKHYSSGMYMRLAFAVAAHLTVELLFVDEVLAVGDAAFQRKCLGKIGETTKTGRTVLFVSHNMSAMRNLCTRVLWLASGKVVRDGNPAQLISQYLSDKASTALESTWTEAQAKNPAAGYLRRAALNVENTQHIDTDTPLEFEFEYVNRTDGVVLNLSMHLYNLDGVCIFNSISPSETVYAGVLRAQCNVPGGFLNDGRYRIQIMIVKDTSVILSMHDEALVFEIHDAPRNVNWYGKWNGVVRPVLPWNMSSLRDEDETVGISSLAAS